MVAIRMEKAMQSLGGRRPVHGSWRPATGRGGKLRPAARALNKLAWCPNSSRIYNTRIHHCLLAVVTLVGTGPALLWLGVGNRVPASC